MKNLIAFIGINAMLFAANAVGAAAVVFVGQLAAEFQDDPWIWLLAGYAAAGAGVAFAIAIIWLVTLRPIR